ncbi:MAG: TRAP transporter large permease subunit [Castellaniella sp.]|uniref:TRAP transporter large permease n=1 Tax=Castellaniella sp. TaxID=1955812 RepID=UPI003C709242
MSHELITLTMFSSLLVLMTTGQRVYGVVGFIGATAAYFLWGGNDIEMPFNATFTVLNWFALLTLPLFVFMGFMLSESGLADKLYRMFHVWMGPLPGGLGIGTIGLMVLISAMNGLSVAGMAIGASVALPQMMQRGYDKVMVTGVIQAGSSLGILIPPSIVLVLYAMIARQPVLQLWIAGILPGLLMAALFTIYIYIRCRMNPELGPPLSAAERKAEEPEKWRLLGEGILPVVIFAVMMGCFMTGVTSLVETSALGAGLATIAAAFKGRLNGQVMEACLRQTLSVSCMFMWIILAALCFGAVYDGLGAIKAIEKLFLNDMGLDRWTILIIMMLSFIVLGMFLDDTAMLVIVAPLYIPLVKTLGFSPIWFGILYTITCQLAYIIPPFGYNLFLMRAMAPPEITIIDIYKSIVPFAFLMMLTLAIIMIFPEIALWLPDMYSNRAR